MPCRAGPGELSGGGGLDGCGWGGGLEESDALENIEAAAAEELVDDGLGEAGGIVLDADGAVGLVEVDAADAVDFAQAGEAKGGGLRGCGAISVQNINGCHAGKFISAEVW